MCLRFLFVRPGQTHTHTRLCIIGTFLMASHFMFCCYLLIYFFFVFSFGNACFCISTYNAREMMTPKIFGHHTHCGCIYLYAPEHNGNNQRKRKKKKNENHYQFKCIRLPLSEYYTHAATSFACDRNTKNENCINYGKRLSLIGLIIIDVCINRVRAIERANEREKGDK